MAVARSRSNTFGCDPSNSDSDSNVECRSNDNDSAIAGEGGGGDFGTFLWMEELEGTRHRISEAKDEIRRRCVEGRGDFDTAGPGRRKTAVAVKTMITAVMTTGWRGEGSKGGEGRRDHRIFGCSYSLAVPIATGRAKENVHPAAEIMAGTTRLPPPPFSPLLSSSSAIAPASGTGPHGEKHDTAGADMGRPVHGPAQYPHP